jgi:HEAT repeat protein
MKAILWMSMAIAVVMTAAVVIERAIYLVAALRWRYIEGRYRPLLPRAMEGDEAALDELANCPPRRRLAVAYLLITPLIEDRDPDLIDASRRIAGVLSIPETADRYLRSRRWWRRSVALRALGLIQARDHTAAVVAALDDPHPDVRAAALDALADLRDPAALSAIVVRLLDTSLDRARRVAALTAFGEEAEQFVLEVAELDRTHRLSYARALAICGTPRARPVLCRWTADERPDVRAAAFEALAKTGLDSGAAERALDALEDADENVRATAARALSGWPDERAAARLARHVEDTWTVALPAARALQSMGEPGGVELRALATRKNLAGLLARQMLWRPGAALA